MTIELTNALNKGDIDSVIVQLQQQPHLLKTTSPGQLSNNTTYSSYLEYAINQKNPKAIKALYEMDSEAIEKCTKDGISLFHLAVIVSDEENVDTLKALIDVTSNKYNTPYNSLIISSLSYWQSHNRHELYTKALTLMNVIGYDPRVVDAIVYGWSICHDYHKPMLTGHINKIHEEPSLVSSSSDTSNESSASYSPPSNLLLGDDQEFFPMYD